jgi:hypothetical protein
MQVPSAETALRATLTKLKRYGILMETHLRLPSVAATVAGHPIRGSWWGHPRGHEIFYVARQMASHPDVVVTKLVSKRVTYVHRNLWPAILAVGSARQNWQLSGLSPTARELLALVDKTGRIRTDRIRLKRSLRKNTVADAARELEVRLLVHSQEIHTESGAHAKVLQTWKVWIGEGRLAVKKMLPEDAKRRLEKLLADLNSGFDTEDSLPWS